MRVVRLHGEKDFRWHDENTPVPGAGEALIRIASVSVCASDVHWYLDGRIGPTKLNTPTVLGHEASGTVVELGVGVKDLKVGTRVAIEPAKPCGTCECCRNHFFNVCPNVQFFGVPPTDGAFREYLAWPATLLAPVPDNVTFDEAALTEPLGVGIHAVKISQFKCGASAAILGAGAIGLSVLQYLKAMGAKHIVVSDPIPERCALALKMGASTVCAPDEVLEVVSQESAGRGVDIVFESAGEASALMQSTEICRIMGQIVVIGIPYDNSYVFEASNARRKQLQVVFSRRSNEVLEEAVSLTAGRKVDLASFATHIFSLDNLEAAFKLAARREDGVIRAVVRV